VISYRLETPHSQLKIFGWAGRSTNEFDRLDSTEIHERYKDFFDIDYENTILGTGIKWIARFGGNSTLHLGAAYSQVESDYQRNGFNDPYPETVSAHNKTQLFYSNVKFGMQWMENLHLLAGLEYSTRNVINLPFRPLPLTDRDVLRPYIELMWSISPKLFIDLGTDIRHTWTAGVNSNYQIGYKALLRLGSSFQNGFFAGIRHAGDETVSAIGFPDGETTELKVDQYEIGWDLSGSQHSIQMKSYFKTIDRLSVFQFDAGYYHQADFTEPISGDLLDVNTLHGKARYYGIEGQWEYRHPKGWKMTINQSLFKASRNINGGEYTEGRFHNRYATHLTLSKEIIRKKQDKNRIWNFSLRGFLNGGLKEPGIEIGESQQFQATVYDDPYRFWFRLPAYKRLDIGIYRTVTKPHIRWRYALEIQNVLGTTNIAHHYYDPFLERIEAQDHLGIIPVLSAQVSW
jgi:outer membrane receptor protein involved in Fe transport